MGDWRRSAILSLPMGMQEHDPTNTRTLDISGNKIHAGYTAGATAPTKISGQRGYSFDGGDYFTGLCNGRFNQSAITIAFLFSPNFAAGDGVDHRLIDSTTAQRYMIGKLAGNTITTYSGGTNTLTIALANYQDYWKQSQYNTLVYSDVSGTTRLYLNQVLVGSGATAWNAADPANYWIGSSNAPAAYYGGNIYQVEIFPISLTKTQADDWAKRALMSLNSL